MNNNISFTGINNLYIGKKTAAKFGCYIDSNGFMKRGEKNYLITKIKCNLTNDENGMDLTDFRQAIKKCKNSYQAEAVGETDIKNIELITSRCFVDDNGVPITNSEFILNGISIMANDRRVLPLFSFLAHLTKKMKTLPGSNEHQNKYLNSVNKSIHEEAVRFIENM